MARLRDRDTARAAGGARIGAGVALVLGGCATLGDDLDALAKALVPPTPGEAARQMLDPHDPDNRREGLVLISNSTFGGAEAYLTAYRDYVEHERDGIVKAVAIRALARHGLPQDAPLIAARLVHEDMLVRWEAAKGLQRLHNPTVVRDLLRCLNERFDRDGDDRPDRERTDVRVAAARALGQYPLRRVFEGLHEALAARELAVNTAAEASLETITGQSFGLDLRAWRQWYDSVEDPFAGRREYRYPTYSRRETWLERLAFWSADRFEEPGLPAGLRPPSERRTYDDREEEPAASPPGG